jgi:hypothetical protein
MSDPKNSNPSGPEDKKNEESQDAALPGEDILDYLKKREGKSNPVMQFLNPKKLDELFGDEGDDAERKSER